MTTVSVLIPSYNHASYIDKAVQSVLEQTFQDYELLISDDCSTDDTERVLRCYQNNPRVTVFVQKRHLGAVEQIHFLVRQAKGKYIALLNSDDYWMPEKLERQVAYMESHPDVGSCFTHAVMVDENGCSITKQQFQNCDIFLQPNRTRTEWLSFFLTNGNALAHPSILARRGLYENEYRLNPALRQLPDYDLWTRYLQRHDIHVIQEPLTMHRRVHDHNTSAQTEQNTKLLYREQAWIRSRLIENLSEEDFRLIFFNQLRNKHCTDVDVLCEKYFILVRMSEDEPALVERAADFFLRHAENPLFMLRMMDGYGYTDSDFFKMLQQRGIAAPMTQHGINLKHFLRRIIRGIRRRCCMIFRK